MECDSECVQQIIQPIIHEINQPSQFQIAETSVQIIGIIVTAVTLLIIIFQLKSQNKSLKLQMEEIKNYSYERSASDYTALINKFIDKPDLGRKFYDEIASKAGWNEWSKLSKEEKETFQLLELHYEIINRAYYYIDKNEDPETWENWKNWLKFVSKHPLFEMVHDSIKDTFDKKYVDEVAKIIHENKTMTKNE